MKALIVDDEPIERESLKKVIAENIAEIKEIRMAANGRNAIEQAAEFHPDFIMMDVKMPGIDGLEAIKRIREFDGEVKFIVISAYDTFEYARQAIRLGVSDYLLKPSKKNVILETVSKVMRDIENERQILRMHDSVKERLDKLIPIVESDMVTLLLFGHIHDVQLDEMMSLLSVRPEASAYVMVLFVGNVQDAGEGAPDCAGELYGAVKDGFHELADGFVGAMVGFQIPIIVFEPKDDRSFRGNAAAVIHKLLQNLREYPDHHFFVGIGNPHGSIYEMKHSYHEALLASADQTAASRHSYFADLGGKHPAGSMVPILEREKEMLEYARIGNWSRLEEALMELILQFEAGGVGILEAQQRIMEIIVVLSRMLHDMGFRTAKPLFSVQITNYQLLRAETNYAIQGIRDKYREAKNSLSPDIFQVMKQYIIEHAHDEISLDRIADEVNLSPYYVSKLFKEQFDMNYIDFLTECRIEKAKVLMADPEKSLKAIALDVGYKDPNYFSRVFKKHCELSPTEYRKKLLS